jgi:zeaxanthin glucosyltransferase
MPKILIDILPAKGHLHATLKMASILKSGGFNVVYGSQSVLQKDVEKHGFNFFQIPVVLITNINFINGITSLKYIFHNFFESLSNSKLQSAKRTISEFEKNIVEINPNIVLLDEQTALKVFLYEKLGIPVIVFQTKPDTRRIKSIPPFTSYYLPFKNKVSDAYCNLLWKMKVSKLKFNKWHGQIISLGQNNYSILKKIFKKFGFNVAGRIDLERSFSIGVKGVTRVIISPKAFDFPHSDIEGTYRVGPLADVKREGKITMRRYQPLLSRMEKERPGSFVVYCSMGTITAGFKKKVKRFFMNMAEVARLNPGFLVIISTGKDFDINELFPAPDNLFIFDHVPQVDLLQYCNVMVTHGGMNSITECVFCEVPMLVYPLSPNWDQPGNSARVVYHGLGLRGKINKDSAKTISNKLNQIKSKTSFYKKNVLDMKEKFEETNNSDEVIEIILNKTKQK